MTGFRDLRGAPFIRRGLGLLAVLAVLAGCTPGPSYHAPQPPGVARYTRGAEPQQTAAARGPAGNRQQFKYGAKLDRLWWHLFHSPEMNRLMRRALAHNPSLTQAQAALAQAQQNAIAALGVFYPQVGATAGAARQKTSGAGSGGSFPGHTFTLYTGNLVVSYSPDFFGLNRLVAHAEQAQVDRQRYLRDAAYLTLEGNVANAVIQQAQLRSQVRVTDAMIRQQRALSALVLKQFRAGALPYASVLTQRQQLATSEATRATLNEQLATSRHALAVLTGAFPATAHAPRVALDELTLPGALPVALPSALVRKRPDIRAAEAGLRFANANIGEAVARMYPLLTLSAGFGTQSNRLSDFFLPANRIYNLAAGLTAPIWDGGTLEANKRAAIAAYEGAIAAYQGTVLAAFQQVADALRALQYDAQTLRFQERAVAAANGALKLSEIQYRDGAVQYLTVLTAEIQDATARSAYVQARAQRYRDSVGLLVALGGGWWPHGAATAPRKSSASGAHLPLSGHDTRFGP